MNAAVAVGFFDGVHLGHQRLLRGASAVLTFRNHPLSVLDPARAPQLIMTPAAKLDAIRACGVERVEMLEFTADFANLSPDEFLDRHVLPLGDAVTVRCGANWRFGRGGAGDADYARRRGISVETVGYADYRGERISSTRIRACLADGDLESAAAMTGRAFELSGIPVPGKGMGRTLGFPTVNLRLDGYGGGLPVPQGAYAVRMHGLAGVANLGVAPTMGERAWNAPVLEVHLLEDGFADAAGGGSAKVELLRFLRPERKFGSVEELRTQIAADVEEAARVCGKGSVR